MKRVLLTRAQIEFRCPVCGSSDFGSAGTHRDGGTGCCHGRLENGRCCRFTWRRGDEEDAKVMRLVAPLSVAAMGALYPRPGDALVLAELVVATPDELPPGTRVAALSAVAQAAGVDDPDEEDTWPTGGPR